MSHNNAETRGSDDCSTSVRRFSYVSEIVLLLMTGYMCISCEQYWLQAMAVGH